MFGENYEALSYSEQYEVSARLLANPSLPFPPIREETRILQFYQQWGGGGAARRLQYP